MNVVKEFPIRQSFAGFKYYLKVYAFAIRYEISLQEDKDPLVKSNIKSYSSSLRESLNALSNSRILNASE